MLVARSNPKLHLRRENRPVVAEEIVAADLEDGQSGDERGVERHYSAEIVVRKVQVLERLHAGEVLRDRPVQLV